MVNRMTNKIFSKKIITWYSLGHRDLPWRRSKDPYLIWLSEVILQQTRVAQGLPYYERFIKNFPNVGALAKAPLTKVLRQWEGLGYYSRARNLHACAKKITSSHGGKFPQTFEELMELPGIGSYTAAAIASIAFDQPIAVVDGNVFRVLSRVFGIEDDISSHAAKAIFAQKANALLDSHQPGTFNQALMEFGAMHCTPKLPQCDSCIFTNGCFARQTEMQSLLPVKTKKVKVRNRYFNYFIFMQGKRLAMRKRKTKDIWKDLYDFYLVESDRRESAKKTLSNDPLLRQVLRHAVITEEKLRLKHLLSHQIIDTHFTKVVLPTSFKSDKLFTDAGMKFYSVKQITALPKPGLISRFLAEMKILE